MKDSLVFYGAKNESLMVYSSALGNDEIIRNVWKVDNIKYTEKSVTECLKEVNFCLVERSWNSEELISSQKITRIPDEVLTFLSTLFNICKGQLMSSSPYPDLLCGICDALRIQL